MSNLLCHSGTSGALGAFGLGSWIGLILNLILWTGLLAGLALLAIRVIRGAKAPAVTGPSNAGPLTSQQSLQAQYARGEITRDEYEPGGKDTE